MVNLDEKHTRTISASAATSLNITEMLTQEEDIIELLEPEEDAKPLEVPSLKIVVLSLYLPSKIGLCFPIVGNKYRYF